MVMGVSPTELLTLNEAELYVLIETLNRLHGARNG